MEFINTWQTCSFTALELTSNFCQLISGQFERNVGCSLGDSSNTWISKFVSLLVWLMVLILKERQRNTLNLSDVFEGRVETSIWECMCCNQLVWPFWTISFQSETSWICDNAKVNCLSESKINYSSDSHCHYFKRH